MKKFILTLIVAMSACSTFAQSVDETLRDLNAFVNTVKVTEETTAEEMAVLNAQYDELNDAYKKVKKQATDEQLQEHARIAMQYKKRVFPYYKKKTGDKLSKTGKAISKWAKKQYKKAQGSLEGLSE